MSRQLIESIVAGDMLEASDMLEAKLDEIKERKMYEMKRMFATKMDEAFGGKDPAELRAKGYERATDVLGLSPYDKRKQAKEKQMGKVKATKARKAAPTKAEPETPTYKRPGVIKRNVNTFMGREPGYVDDRTPEEKLRQKGGTVGKIARSLTGSLKDIGFQNLE